jgi:hypothetical protein
MRGNASLLVIMCVCAELFRRLEGVVDDPDVEADIFLIVLRCRV